MKRCITFSLAFLLMSSQLIAQVTLTVFSNDSPFTLYVNGVQKNVAPTTHVKVPDVPGSQCSVRVSFQDSSIPEVKQQIFLEEADNLIYEIRKNKKGNRVLRLLSADEASQLSEPEVQATVSQPDVTKRDNEVKKVEKAETSATMVAPKAASPTQPVEPTEQQPVNAEEQKPTPAPFKNPYERYRNARGFCKTPNLSAEDILRMRVRMDEKSNNESWRAAYLKETVVGYIATPGKCVTCKQYADLMNKYLTSDTHKYDVARTLFMKVYDPGNFDLIRETFKDNTYKQKLDDITLDYLASSYGGESPASNQSAQQTTNTSSSTNTKSSTPGSGGQTGNESTVNSPTSNNDNRSSSSDKSQAKKSTPNSPPSCTLSASKQREIKSTIESKTGSSTRLSTAKEILKDKCLTVQQVIDFLDLFSVDSQRLEFAKYAYDINSDKANGHRILNKFSMESTAKDFKEYMNTRVESR
ncbi:MAG TPA: DUF4476 domain-containing protein [Cyclobacteriaceae bacterium]|nr:DUF4476 domain-containing protein [Cyclobacteriaceae bacterium]